MNYPVEILCGLCILAAAVIRVVFPYVVAIAAWETVKQVWRKLK